MQNNVKFGKAVGKVPASLVDVKSIYRHAHWHGLVVEPVDLKYFLFRSWNSLLDEYWLAGGVGVEIGIEEVTMAHVFLYE